MSTSPSSLNRHSQENPVNQYINSFSRSTGIAVSQQARDHINRVYTIIRPVATAIIEKSGQTINQITNWTLEKAGVLNNANIVRIARPVLKVLVGISLAVLAFKASSIIVSFAASLLIHSITAVIALAAVVCAGVIAIKYMINNGYLRWNPQNFIANPRLLEQLGSSEINVANA